MSLINRKIKFCEAMNEAFMQMMELDQDVILMGQGVKSPWYVGDTAKGLLERFGPERVIDTPVSENAVTGAAVGAALVGMRPIVMHPRMDFMLYAIDPIINEAANWSYMLGGNASVPLVVWGIVNRGGEQAAQHSQAFQAMFAHVPGLKVVMPSTAYDAKGLMISAILDNNPVIFVDDRWLHNMESDVPEEVYTVPIGKGIVRKDGKDVTLAATSYMAVESLKAANELQKQGIDVEVIDLRTIKPMDKDILLESVKKTGRLVIADGTWKSFGVAAEIMAVVCENGAGLLKSSPVRVTLPDIPAPASAPLEEIYYPKASNIIWAIQKVFFDKKPLMFGAL